MAAKVRQVARRGARW